MRRRGIPFPGGGHTPLPNLGPLRLAAYTDGPIWQFGWLSLKVLALLFTQVWIRWTLPRLRIDQLMHLGWKVLTPATLLMLLATLAWRML